LTVEVGEQERKVGESEIVEGVYSCFEVTLHGVGIIIPGTEVGEKAIYDDLHSSKSQSLYRAGKLGIFPSARAFVWRESYVQRPAPHFARSFALPSPRAYTGGKARNVSKPKSLPHIPSYFSHNSSYFLCIVRSWNFSKYQSLYRGEELEIFPSHTEILERSSKF